MEKDFDFNTIGKRTPFRTPEGFFEHTQADILKRAEKERKMQRLSRIRIGVSAALAAAAMVCGVVFSFERVTATDVMDLYVRNLTEAELQEWIEFSENDIYYELTTENLNENED